MIAAGRCLLSCLLPFLFCSTLFARDLSDIQKTKSIRVGTEGTLVPFNFFKDSQLTGFEVELANHIFAELGWKADWKTGAFSSLLVGLGNDQYDITVASHAITPERMKAVEFLNPHYCSGPVILSLQSGPSTVKDLSGKVAAAKVGTIYFSALEKVSGIKSAKSLPNNADLIQALLLKKVDAIILNEFAAEQMIKAHPQVKLKTGESLMEERLGIAVAKGNFELRDLLNKYLQKAMADGTYVKLSQKYFARDIRCK